MSEGWTSEQLRNFAGGLMKWNLSYPAALLARRLGRQYVTDKEVMDLLLSQGNEWRNIVAVLRAEMANITDSDGIELAGAYLDDAERMLGEGNLM